MALFTLLKADGGQNGKTYYFRGRSDLYKDAVAGTTGISVAPTNEQSEVPTKLEDLLGKGALIRVVVTYGSGGSSNKTAHLVCTRAKLSTCLDGLIGETIRGQLILSARIPRKASFY